MEVALQALRTLDVFVWRWGGVKLGFAIGSRGVERAACSVSLLVAIG